jgi:hypothetical protein
MVIENRSAGKNLGYTLSVVVTRTIEDDVLRSSVPDEARRAFLGIPDAGWAKSSMGSPPP